jgi:hypothetical protein
MMLDFKLGSKGLVGFARALEKGHKKSFNRAMRAETFRLFRKTQEQMVTGSGYPKRSPLANLMAAKSRGLVPYKWAKPAVAFTVKQVGGEFVATIGPSIVNARGKKGIHPAYLEPNVEGRSIKITKARQARIAQKLKQKKPGKSRKFYARRIPKLGVLKAPRRPYADILVRREGGEKSSRNIAALYEIAQRGEGWSKTWWITE